MISRTGAEALSKGLHRFPPGKDVREAPLPNFVRSTPLYEGEAPTLEEKGEGFNMRYRLFIVLCIAVVFTIDFEVSHDFL